MPSLSDPHTDPSVLHMHAGMAALNSGDWQPALGHFNEAIRLRETLSWRDHPQSAWLLAAAWINRSDALRRMEKPALLTDALRSLDHAIAAMRHVSLADHPVFPERLILAWINRATTCGEMREPAAALKNFQQAESLLDTWGRDTSSARRFITAMLLVNRARVLLQADQPIPAWENARAAAEVLHGVNAPSAIIKARSIQCRALAHLLDAPGGLDDIDDWIAEATDAAEEALTLVKATGYLDVWVADLVRYGAKIYRVCQPQFLTEFLSDWLIDGPLSGDAVLRRDMRHEILLAQAEVEQRVFLASEDTGYVENQTRILKRLQTALLQLPP